MTAISNGVPMHLFRKPAAITVLSQEGAQKIAAGEDWVSAWGHPETLYSVADYLGILPQRLIPMDKGQVFQRRPTIVRRNGHWTLFGQEVTQILVISADLPPGGARGVAFPSHKVEGWTPLLITPDGQERKE